MRKLLLAWLKSAKESAKHRKYCPECYSSMGNDGACVHHKDCIVKRTQDYLKRGQGRKFNAA